MITASGRNLFLYIDDDSCQACSPCMVQQVCKYKAILRIDRDEPPFIDSHRCNGCRVCLAECPFAAIAAADYAMGSA